MRDSSSKLDSAKLVGTYDVIQCRSTPANIVDIFNYAVDISLSLVVCLAAHVMS